MSDREAFLAAVIARPDDDLPRLIYADWLEEQPRRADHARGEFIRLQCLAATLPVDDARRIEAEARATVLNKSWIRQWNGDLHRMLADTPFGTRKKWRRVVRRWEYRRGFVERVTALARELIEYGTVIRRLGPLRAVRATNCGWADFVDLIESPTLEGLTELDLHGTLATASTYWAIEHSRRCTQLLRLRINSQLVWERPTAGVGGQLLFRPPSPPPRTRVSDWQLRPESEKGWFARLTHRWFG